MPSVDLLRAALFCPAPEGWWGLPLLLWGPPGTGKTAMIKRLARTLALPYVRLSPAERGEGQFGVVPVPALDAAGNGVLHYPPPAWSRDLANGGLIFVDEINTAAPALQAPLLGLIQLRTLGEHQFPSRVRVIAAANETKDAAGGWDLAPALSNRFGHLEFDGLAPDDWAVGLLGAFSGEHDEKIDPVAEEKRVMAAWPGADAAARGQIAAFILRRKDLLRVQPTKGCKGASRAWPSPRTVEYASVALASARVHGLSEIESDELVTAFVGAAWVTEFASWRANADLPEPEALLDGKVTWKHDTRRIDRTVAVLGACAGLCAPDKAVRRKERAAACWQLIRAVLDDTADIAVPAARVLVRAKLCGATIPESKAPLNKLQPLLAAAGIHA